MNLTKTISIVVSILCLEQYTAYCQQGARDTAVKLPNFDSVAKSTLRSLTFFPLQNNVTAAWQTQRQKLAGLTDYKKLMPLQIPAVTNPFILNSAEASYNRSDNSSYMTGGHSYYGDWELSTNWTVASIPFDVHFNNQSWNDISRNNFSNVGIQFNKDQYLQQLKKKMKDRFNPEQFINTDLRNQVEAIKDGAGALLQKDLEGINKTFGNQLNEKIAQMGNLKGMLTGDMSAVREQLMSNEYVQAIANKERLLSELQNRKNSGQVVNDQDFQTLEKEVAQLKGVHALLHKIEEHKNKWQSSGLLNKLKQMELLDKAQVEKVIRNPATTIKMARQYLQLNGLQKLFLKLNSLNIGQNTLSASPLSVNHMLNKGINTEFFDKNRLLSLGMGRLKTFNAILDQPFTNSLQSNDGMARMFRFGIGSQSASHSHVSLMTYDQTPGGSNSFVDFGNFSNLSSFRKTVVTTISNRLLIGERGSITTELSRSATTYQQAIESDTTLAGKPAMQRILGADNLMNNMAIAVKYEDEWVDQQLSYGVRANFTAPGYNNPGSSYLNAGGKELGLQVKKLFWKGRLQASVRSDMREFDYSDEGDRVYRNLYSVMDLRLKLRKGQSIGIRYMPNKMSRVEKGRKSTLTQLDRLSIDGSLAQKIAGLYYRNTFTLAYQRNRFVLDNQLVKNTTLTVSGFQNITLNGKLVYINTTYDHASNNSQYVFFNSSLITEAGVTYMVLKKISLSSALSYNSVKGWYKQAGIKQTVSGQFNERFSLNIHVDARKNLEVKQPLLFGPFRTDISIHYLISK